MPCAVRVSHLCTTENSMRGQALSASMGMMEDWALEGSCTMPCGVRVSRQHNDKVLS